MDDENSTYHNEEVEPKPKTSKWNKSTHRSKEDGDSKGNFISLRRDESWKFFTQRYVTLNIRWNESIKDFYELGCIVDAMNVLLFQLNDPLPPKMCAP